MRKEGLEPETALRQRATEAWNRGIPPQLGAPSISRLARNHNGCCHVVATGARSRSVPFRQRPIADRRPGGHSVYRPLRLRRRVHTRWKGSTGGPSPAPSQRSPQARMGAIGGKRSCPMSVRRYSYRGRVVLIELLGQNSGLDGFGEPIRERIPRDAERFLEVIELRHSVKGISEDDHRPYVAEHFGGATNRAWPTRHFACHRSTLAIELRRGCRCRES